MNQKVAWGMLIGGLVFFLGQAAELIANHSTWGELTTPATFADFLRLLASVVPTVAGALGIVLPTKGDSSSTSSITRPPSTAAVIILATSLVLAAPACASKYGGAVNTNPTVSQVTATRELAIKISGGVETASGIGVQALKFADGLEKSGVLPASTLATIATASSRFGKVADETLKRLDTVASRPELVNTLRALFAELDPLLAALEKSGNQTLTQLASALRIATTVARTVLT